MADGISITLDGGAAFNAALQKILRHAEDVRPLLDDIGQRLEARIENRFDLKRDPGGTGWAPWAASTVAKYNKADRTKVQGGGTEVRRRGTLLQRSGLMRDSLAHVVNADSVRVGFGREPALYHEFGTRKMPRRGLIMANPEAGTLGDRDMAEVLALAERFFAKAL